MRKELENQLAEKFPFMKRENPWEDPARPNVITDLYAAFGCDVGDGWYSVIFGLCEEISAAYEQAGVPVDMRPIQIKEKYGTLRFCVDFEETKERTELHKEIWNIINQWEEKSATVCEDCGKPGKLRTDRDWFLTLCDVCNKISEEADEDENKEEPKIIRNRAKCLQCGDILESKYRHDFNKIQQ